MERKITPKEFNLSLGSVPSTSYSFVSDGVEGQCAVHFLKKTLKLIQSLIILLLRGVQKVPDFTC